MDTSISRPTQPCQGLVLLMAVALAALHSPLALPQLKPAVLWLRLKQDWPDPGTAASPSSYQVQSMRFILGLQSVSCLSVPDTA